MGSCENHQSISTFSDTLFIRKPIHSTFDYNHWCSLLAQVNGCPGLLLPLSYKYESQSFCTLQDHLLLEYPAFQHTLQDEIVQRSKSGTYFDDEYLWRLAESLLHSCDQVERVGDIRPAQIKLAKGKPFCVCLYSWPYELTPFRKALHREGNIHYFLAPEQSSALREGMEMFCYDEKKADVYRIGLTLLQASLLFQQLPHNQYHQIEKASLSSFIEQAGQRFPGLDRLISKMTEQFSERRPSPRALLNQLQKIQSGEHSGCLIPASTQALIELEQILDLHIQKSLRLMEELGVNMEMDD